jgi:hypothetical protein
MHIISLNILYFRLAAEAEEREYMKTLDLRWTAAVSTVARFIVRTQKDLRDIDMQACYQELTNWLPCAGEAIHPVTGKICRCNQPRALHGTIHRCSVSGHVWQGLYQPPGWTFDPTAECKRLVGQYTMVMNAPSKFSMMEARMAKSERPDHREDNFFAEVF